MGPWLSESKRSQKLLLIFTTVVFLIFVSFSYQNKALSFHFVDEEDNLVLGKYLWQGERLYSDLFSHHQPLGYIISEAIQKIANPNSLFLLVKRHREVVIAWSLIWGLLLTIRFGSVGLGGVIVYELTKYRLLGQLFLSESLVVYPVIFICLVVLERRKLSSLATFWLGLWISFCFFLLSPIWPLLILLIGMIVYFQKDKLRFGWYLWLGFLPIAVVVFRFIDLRSYLVEAFWINFQYYIPITSHEWVFLTLAKAVLAPVISWFVTSFSSPTLWLIRLLSLALLMNLIVLARLRMWSEVVLTVGLLGLANIRYSTPGLEIYSGFHLLIWFGLLIFLTVRLTFKNYQRFVYPWRFGVVVCLTLSLVVAQWSASEGLFKKDDLNTQYYINYSRQFVAGEAIRIIKSPEDALFVAPDEWLIYYQADIKHASRMVNFYAWMNETPMLMNEVNQLFLTNPPTFLYINMPGTGFEKYFPSYVRMRREGHDSDLLVKPERLNSLSEDQKNRLRYFNYEI